MYGWIWSHEVLPPLPCTYVRTVPNLSLSRTSHSSACVNTDTHDCANKAMVKDMPVLDHDMIQHIASAIRIQTGTLCIVNNQQMRRFWSKEWCVFLLEVKHDMTGTLYIVNNQQMRRFWNKACVSFVWKFNSLCSCSREAFSGWNSDCLVDILA